jgi:hypothetical protein
VIDGDRNDFQNLLNYVWTTQTPATMLNPAIYTEVGRRLDLSNFADYCLINAYVAMGDWPANNWRAGRERTTNAIWRFVLWDAEWAMGIYSLAVTRDSFAFSGTGTEDAGLNSTVNSEIAQFYQRLRVNPEFRLLCADRIQKHFFNGGALTGLNISNRFNQLRTELLGVIPSMDTEILGWARDRLPIIMGQFNTYGLYGYSNALYGVFASSNAPSFNQHGGSVVPGFNLTLTAPIPGSAIYFTTNGADPRVKFSGAVSNAALAYTAPVALNQSVLIRARSLLNGTNWSALEEATFEVARVGLPLRITELHYNPLEGSAYEFIELQNVGTATLNLSGMTMVGVSYSFPLGTTLAPGATMVLIADDAPAAFAARYPGVVVAGAFVGSLNNGGERIAILDANGNLVTSVDYDDEGGWPTTPDGGGFSLEVIDPLGDPDDPANWRASAVQGGTPGVVSPPPALPQVRLNEVMAENLTAVNNGGTYPDWVELLNAGPGSAALDGWSLTDDGNARRFVFPAGTTLLPGEYRVVWCDDSTNTTPGLHTGFLLGRNGESVYLYDAATNLVDAITFGLQLPDYSVGRLAGGWQLTSPTPNALNSAATLGSATNLSINEWLANAAPGQPDWIELFNRSFTQPVALRGVFLATTSAVQQLTTLSFLGPRGFAQFFADEGTGPDHLDFKLPAAGGAIILYDQTATEFQRVTYTNQTEGVTQGRLPDGSGTIVSFPGTASPKTNNYTVTYSGPYLNEVMARNKSAVTNALGQVVDWVELFNPGASAFSLAGMSLSADSLEPGQWVFPAGASIAANGYLVVGFDGSRPASTNLSAVLNAGHSLDGESGGVYLFNPVGQLVNFIAYGFQVDDLSIGRTGGVWRLLSAPTPGATNAPPAALGAVSALRLNEWMANPASGDDWFEVFNTAALPVELSGLYFTDDPSLIGQTRFKAPPLSFIGPSRWVKWVADGNTAAGRNHVNFDLDAQGESLRIYATNFTIIDAIYFAAQAQGASEGRLPDASAAIVRFPGSASPAESNYLLPETVLINEVLTHTASPLEDAIELHNPSTVGVNLGGWYLSDSQDNFRKYRLADNTILPAGGYRVFYENQFGGPGGFTLDASHGGEVWLSQANAGGNLTGYRATAKFGAALNAVSIGRYVSHLGPDFVVMSRRTFGADAPDTLAEFRTGGGLSNAYPNVGPLVISEIMYHPPASTNSTADPDDEYIELHNIGATATPLHDPVHPTNTWRLANAVSFAFPAGLSLPAGGYLLVVSFDPVADSAKLAAFRATYGLSMSVPIYGPYTGKLDNNGEQLELYQPDAPEPDGFVPRVLVEKINYTDTVPWPAGATDGGGLSLQRRNDTAYANDPENWLASVPTPGAPNGPGIVVPPVVTSSPQGFTALVGAPVSLNVSATGTGPLAYQWRFNQANIPGATNATFVFKDLLVDDEGEYDVFVSNAGGSAFSQSATARVDAPPVILVAPQSATVRGGTNVLFSVLATGSTPLVYEWRLNGVPIPGATGPALPLTNVSASQNGDYTVIVSNRVSTTSTTVTLVVLVTPVLTQHPQGLTVLQGAPVTFTVAATGSPLPFSFRWRFRAVGSSTTANLTNIIVAQTNSAYTIANAHPTNSGTYSVVCTNVAGSSLLSSNVVLTVLADNDHDLIPDDWERLYGFSTNDVSDAASDPDLDGMSNYQEYLAGTDPTNGLSYLRIDAAALGSAPPASLLLTLSAVSNHTYTIICRNEAATGTWFRLVDVQASITNRIVTVTNLLPAGVANRFYRLQTPQLP